MSNCCCPMCMCMRLNTTAWASYQWPHSQGDIDLPSPRTITQSSSSARNWASWALSPFVLEFWLSWLCTNLLQGTWAHSAKLCLVFKSALHRISLFQWLLHYFSSSNVIFITQALEEGIDIDVPIMGQHSCSFILSILINCVSLDWSLPTTKSNNSNVESSTHLWASICIFGSQFDSIIIDLSKGSSLLLGPWVLHLPTPI